MCVRSAARDALRARGSARPASRRSAAPAFSSAWQPRRPSCASRRVTSRQHDSEAAEKKKEKRAPLELAPLFVRLVRHGAFEDRAEEQEPPRAVVQLLVARAVALQDVVDDLCMCVCGPAPAAYNQGGGKDGPRVGLARLRSACRA